MSAQKVKRQVGKYELGQTIGIGTFAKVRLARNLDTGEHVAIKILLKEKVLKHKLPEQIMREIATMKLIKHPNVIRLQELENLLVDASGNLKVSDFGFSALHQQVREDGLLHTTCGTPNYVPPEVLKDRGYDGAPADLWSCGVILFALLAGYLPFDDHNSINLYKKIATANYTFPSWFSFGIKRLLTRILDPNPVTRITISEILEDEWFKKGDKPPVFDGTYETSLDDVHAAFKVSQDHQMTGREAQPAALNAFELIGLSKGLNLGSLFNIEQEFKRETRFTSTCSANEIIRKIEEATKPLGYDIHKKNYKMMLRNIKAGRKGNLNVSAEVFQVAPSLHMVEVRKAKGDTLEFHQFYKTLSTSLKDVIWLSEEDLPAQSPKL